MANASEISTTVINGLSVRGIILPDYVSRNLPAVVQLFIALSSPMRSTLRAFLTSLLGQLKLTKATALTKIGQCDVLAQRINTTAAIIDATLAPVDHLLATMPIDSAVGMSPDLSALLKKITDLCAIKIPVSFFTGGKSFDMFDGVNSYADLRKKGNDLLYLTAQATSASYYAQTTNKIIDDQILEVEAYLYILDTLDMSVRTLIIDTGTSSLFTPTVVGQKTYMYVRLTNQSNSPSSIGGTYSLSGNSDITLANSAITTFLLATSTISLDIVLKFQPITVGTASGSLSIVHDADNVASPIIVSLRGTGL
jgi:hypothetical protein